MSGGCGQTVCVWGRTPPAFQVVYESPLGPWDSGFSVMFDDAPTVADLEFDPRPPALICLDCLLGDHPELGRAMDIAREHGSADLHEAGEWGVGSLPVS